MLANGCVGVDIAHCRDAATGEIDAAAVKLMAQLATYFEVSPSGTGLHGIARGMLPGKGRRRAVFGLRVEMYSRLRYFTVTGHHVEETPADICPCTDAWLRLDEAMAPCRLIPK